MAQVVEQFEIVLEHDIDEQYQYEPAEMLSGTIVLKVTEPLKITAIQVHIRGESAVSWEEEGRQPVTYKADEVYIDVTQNVVVAQPGELLTLDCGMHRYPMEYILPDNLPSSFIGKHGSITYVVKATLKEDKRFGLSTMITSEPFLVLRKLDISKEHKLLMAREENLVKRFSGGLAFCVRGKVTCNFKLNKTGHVPGEDIFMDAEISNQSPRVIEAIEASIIMHSTFHARNKTRYNRQVVNKKRDEWELTEGEGRRWTGVRLTIPPYIPESRLDGCDIIDIKYELHFRIDISGKNNQMMCTIPLTVGSATSLNGQQPTRTYKTTSSTASMSNWRSKNDMYDAATLPIRGDSGAGAPNSESEYQSEIRSEQDVDPEMYNEETLRFRRPIDIGETRHNPLMDLVAEDGDHGLVHSDHGLVHSDHDDAEDDNARNDMKEYERQVSGPYHGGDVNYNPDQHLHIEPDTTEGMSDDDDDDVPKKSAAPPPPPSSAPPPPPLRPGP